MRKSKKLRVFMTNRSSEMFFNSSCEIRDTLLFIFDSAGSYSAVFREWDYVIVEEE